MDFAHGYGGTYLGHCTVQNRMCVGSTYMAADGTISPYVRNRHFAANQLAEMPPPKRAFKTTAVGQLCGTDFG